MLYFDILLIFSQLCFDFSSKTATTLNSPSDAPVTPARISSNTSHLCGLTFIRLAASSYMSG